MSLRVTLHFSPSAWVPAWDHQVEGTVAEVRERVEALLATRTYADAWAYLTWGEASVEIQPHETLEHALAVCRRDLADPSTCFGHADEEADCLALVAALSQEGGGPMSREGLAL